MFVPALGKPRSPPAIEDSVRKTNPITTGRLSAAKNAIGDKLDETAHRNKAEAHKQYAKA